MDAPWFTLSYCRLCQCACPLERERERRIIFEPGIVAEFCEIPLSTVRVFIG